MWYNIYKGYIHNMWYWMTLWRPQPSGDQLHHCLVSVLGRGWNRNWQKVTGFAHDLSIFQSKIHSSNRSTLENHPKSLSPENWHDTSKNDRQWSMQMTAGSWYLSDLKLVLLNSKLGYWYQNDWHFVPLQPIFCQQNDLLPLFFHCQTQSLVSNRIDIHSSGANEKKI